MSASLPRFLLFSLCLYVPRLKLLTGVHSSENRRAFSNILLKSNVNLLVGDVSRASTSQAASGLRRHAPSECFIHHAESLPERHFRPFLPTGSRKAENMAGLVDQSRVACVRTEEADPVAVTADDREWYMRQIPR